MTIRIGDFKPSAKQMETICNIINSGRITENKYVDKLERAMEKYLDIKNAILTTNGTVALNLVAHYIKHVKEIKQYTALIPAMTFPATMNAFLMSDYGCMLCDIGEDLQMNIDSLTEEEKKSIDVIVPVHLMGYSCNMDKIMDEAKKYGWIVIEDACESFGAEFNNKKVGTFGDFGCYSFFVSHNLPAGELGLIITNDDEAAKILRSMKNHGRAGDNLKFEHKYIGSNYKTNEFCAGLCYAQMEDVDDIIKKRLDTARYFFDNINNPNLEQFHCPDDFSPLGYPIEAKDEEYRKYICDKLNSEGIETRHIFPYLANQECYKNFFHGEFPDHKIAKKLEKTVFYIPCHQFLSQEDKEKIVQVINDEIY